MSRQRNRPGQPCLCRPCASGQRQVKGGLFSSGGLSITVGKQQQSTDQQNTATGAAASTVGAVAGDVNIVAGQRYTQVGSNVVAPGGDINVLAQDIAILDARTSQASQTEQKFKQSGLTLAISAPVVTALQGVANTAQAIGNTGNARMQALGAAALAMQGKQALDGLNGMTDAIKGGANPAEGASVGISLSIGASKSSNTSQTQANQAQGSTLSAAGDVNLIASAAGKASNILIQGAEVQAGDTVRLSADNQVNLLAAQNTTTLSNSSKTSSASIGIGFSVGANTSMGVTVAASVGKGAGAGAETTQSNTRVQAGNAVEITSGGDTTLKGAVVAANTVKANVGGNLNIQSLQDTSTYSEKSRQSGGSVTIGPAPGASISLSKTKVNSNYASVAEQSGIRAGDGGFDVNVAGSTDLKGGTITSTQAAIDAGVNRFNANTEEGLARLTASDIQNTASYSAKSAGVTIGVGSSLGASGAGVGSDKGNDASATQAAISGIAGNKEARTGDAQTGIKSIFDKDKVKDEVNAQVAITTAFGQQAGKAIGKYGDGKLQEAADKKNTAAQESDPERRQTLLDEASALEDAWKEGGGGRVGLHTLAAALGGGASGALGAATSQTLIPVLGDAIGQLDLPIEVKQALTQVAAMGMGAAVGGAAGAASAQNATSQNYLTPRENLQRNRAQAECRVTPASEACATAARLNVLDQSRDRDMAKAAQACNSGSMEACQGLNRTLNQLATQGTAELQQLTRELQPSCAPPKDCANAANWVNNELKTLQQFGNQIWAANASGAVMPTVGPEAVLAGGVVSAIRLSGAGFGLGAGFDATGQLVMSGSVRPEQSLVSGMTGAVGLASFASLPTALRFYGVPAAGAGVAATNTTFNNFFYGEETSVWAAGGLGAVFGVLGPSAGAFAQRTVTPWVTNTPRIPLVGSAHIPIQNRLPNVSGYVRDAVSNTVSNAPSFIPLDNGKPQRSKP